MISYADASKVSAAALVNAMKGKWYSTDESWFKKNQEPSRHRKGHNWSEQKQRTRTWACRFPEQIAGGYTEAQRAAGAAIAAHTRPDGTCDKSEAEIAAIAGCSITTVQNYLYWATQMKHITVQRRPIYDRFGNRIHRNLTNIVRIVSKVWLKFLRWCAEAARGGFKNSRSSKTISAFFLRPATDEACKSRGKDVAPCTYDAALCPTTG